MKKLLVALLVLAAMLCVSASAEKGVLTLPEDLTVIKSQAFYGADGAVKAELPYGLKEIHAEAFANSSIAELNIPPTVTYIADDAFDGCEIELVTVSDGSYGEEYCVGKGFNCRTLTAESAFTVIEVGDNQCEITGYDETSVNVVIPEYIQGMQVVGIGEEAFYYNERLESVELPPSVTYLSTRAFYGCYRMKSIPLENVTSIGYAALGSCAQLKEIALSENLTTLEKHAFAYTGIEYVKVPEGITELPTDVFACCDELTEVVLHENITSIGNYAFSGCSSLPEIILPQSLTSIGNNAFANAASLMYVDIPVNVTSIGEYAFENCANLQLVGLPKSIQVIGDYAFDGVDNAFFITERNCAALDYCKANYKMIILEPNAESDFTVTKLSSTTCKITGYKGSAVDVFLPETIGGRTVTQIGADAFRGNTKIKSVSILNSVTTIGRKAFYGCKNLSYVQMTDLVTSITDNAFDGCDSLEQILVLQLAEAASRAAVLDEPAVEVPAVNVPAVAGVASVAID